MPHVALALAAFGAIACALALVGGAVMLESALAGSAGVLAAVLMVGFVAPLAVFGVIFVALAVYMAGNALLVRVERGEIATTRRLFGFVVSEKRVARPALGGLEPQIAARHQSVFSSAPIFELVAKDASRRQRVVVAESLQGEALMRDVKSLIESAIAPPTQHS